jgi:hypothetical protein
MSRSVNEKSPLHSLSLYRRQILNEYNRLFSSANKTTCSISAWLPSPRIKNCKVFGVANKNSSEQSGR